MWPGDLRNYYFGMGCAELCGPGLVLRSLLWEVLGAGDSLYECSQGHNPKASLNGVWSDSTPDDFYSPNHERERA